MNINLRPIDPFLRTNKKILISITKRTNETEIQDNAKMVKQNTKFRILLKIISTQYFFKLKKKNPPAEMQNEEP